MNENCWIFVIDTNQYAGNFEREICAYITGEIGDCSVGDEMLTFFAEETDKNKEFFKKHILQICDEDGCSHPCEIYINPNWLKLGYGSTYRKNNLKEEKKALISHKKQCKHHIDSEIEKMESYKKRLEKGEETIIKAGWTKESIDKRIEKIKSEFNCAKIETYPAYNSVAIFFKSKPTEAVIKLMKKRAKEYVKNFDYYTKEKIKIEQFRLISQENIQKEIKI